MTKFNRQSRVTICVPNHQPAVFSTTHNLNCQFWDPCVLTKVIEVLRPHGLFNCRHIHISIPANAAFDLKLSLALHAFQHILRIKVGIHGVEHSCACIIRNGGHYVLGLAADLVWELNRDNDCAAAW